MRTTHISEMISSIMLQLRCSVEMTYPNLIWSLPANKAWTVHLANLQALFLNSLAKTAPLWMSSFWRHSTPLASLESHSFNALMVRNWSSPLGDWTTASCSQRETKVCRNEKVAAKLQCIAYSQFLLPSPISCICKRRSRFRLLPPPRQMGSVPQTCSAARWAQISIPTQDEW